MGVDLEDALGQIFGTDGAAFRKREPLPALSPRTGQAVQPQPQALGVEVPAQRAARQYRALSEAARSGDWARFGRELEALGKTLEELSRPPR
jgi:uncharacterized membrane protein (UPF0182 family)